MNKKNAPATNNGSTQDKGNFTSKSEKLRQKLIKDLFRKKAKKCFECDTRLFNSTRKRIATFHKHINGGVLASGHQLCESCAALAISKQYHKLPEVSRDIATAEFIVTGKDTKCAGGVQ